MSRIGNKPITLPAGAECAVTGNHVVVKGPKGTLEKKFWDKLTIDVNEKLVIYERNYNIDCKDVLE